jgi:hypothetical protein
MEVNILPSEAEYKCNCPLCSGKYRDKHLLLLSEVAELIRRDERTVRRYIAEGLLVGHNPSRNGKGLMVVASSVHKYFTEYEFTGEISADAAGTAAPAPTPTTTPAAAQRRPQRRTSGGWVRGY